MLIATGVLKHSQISAKGYKYITNIKTQILPVSANTVLKSFLSLFFESQKQAMSKKMKKKIISVKNSFMPVAGGGNSVVKKSLLR